MAATETGTRRNEETITAGLLPVALHTARQRCILRVDGCLDQEGSRRGNSLERPMHLLMDAPERKLRLVADSNCAITHRGPRLGAQVLHS